MSGNRSVQAAQRRRTGPPEPQIPGRTPPQPSINSSQMFSGQGRTQVPQQQQQQQQPNINNISKMTIAQAITLITLRLGAVEDKLINGGISNNMSIEKQDGQENLISIDNSLIQSIVSRLESLEKRSTTNGSADTLFVKQQLDVLKQSVVQSKGIALNTAKEFKDLKNQIEVINNELAATKEIIALLQNLAMDNANKILALSMEQSNLYDEANLVDENIDYENLNNEFIDNLELDVNGSEDLNGATLKELIESEINPSS